MAEQKTPKRSAQKTSPDADSPKKLYRSRTDRMIGGVCGGLAEYINIDANILRIIWVAAFFFGGFGLLAYILGWIIIPENPDPHTGKKRTEDNPHNTAMLWGIILIIIGAFFLFEQLDWFDYYPFHFRWLWRPYWFWNFRFDLLLPLAIILIGIIYIANVVKKNDSKSETTTGGQSMEKKLTRSVKDRMVAGVCGGLAQYFNIDASLVRIGYALLTLAGGIFFGVIAYIVMMIVIPEETVVETPASGPPKSSSAKAKAKN